MVSISKKCVMIGVAVISAAAALVIGLAFSQKNKVTSNALSSSAAEGISYPFMATETSEGPMHVKLAPGVDASYLERFGSVTPLFTLSYDTLKELSGAKPGLPDLTLWYRVMPDPSIGSAQEVYAEDLLDQEYVTDIVIPVYAPPPSRVRRQLQSGTPDFEVNQGYLRPNSNTNNGIDAEFSWTFEGGNGEGVTIYDVEYSWNLVHEDLRSSIETLVKPGDAGVDPFYPPDGGQHGTAVLGVMIGTSNGFGVKGISYGAKAKVAPENTVLLGVNRANAILLAAKDGKPGDVILLEMQTGACGGACGEVQVGWGPAEWDKDVFDATKVAVGNKIVVVATVGNGNVDLDSPQCNGRFGSNPAQDSGAIIVGAGGSGSGAAGCGPARQKLDDSSFGSRVDVHGWGECVWTTGIGDGHKNAADPQDINTFYTAIFSGTSSAGPFVAAAVANIQGIAMKRFGFPLDPEVVRKLLTDTGLPQLGEGGRIGPLVNLRNAIEKLLDGEITSRPTRKPSRAKANKAGKRL